MLNLKAFGFAGGILWAIVGAWATLLAILGGGAAPFDILDRIYLGWMIPSYPGMAFNAALCFVDAFVGGVVFAWLYNRLAKQKA